MEIWLFNLHHTSLLKSQPRQLVSNIYIYLYVSDQSGYAGSQVLLTVKVLKFLTLVACEKGLDKQRRPKSDCFWRSTRIKVFPVCYSNTLFVNSSQCLKLRNIYGSQKFWRQFVSCIAAYMSHDMGFPTMWYLGPAKAQISRRICAVWSESLLVAWIFYEC